MMSGWTSPCGRLSGGAGLELQASDHTRGGCCAWLFRHQATIARCTQSLYVPCNRGAKLTSLPRNQWNTRRSLHNQPVAQSRALAFPPLNQNSSFPTSRASPTIPRPATCIARGYAQQPTPPARVARRTRNICPAATKPPPSGDVPLSPELVDATITRTSILSATHVSGAWTLALRKLPHRTAPTSLHHHPSTPAPSPSQQTSSLDFHQGRF